MTDQPDFDVDDAIVLLLGSEPHGKEKRGELRGVTRLEKLVFLLERETDAGRILTEDPEFVAYNFGPFSRKVYGAVDQLVEAGLLEDSKRLSQNEDDSWETSSFGADDIQTSYSTRDFKLTDLGLEYYSALVSELPANVVTQAEQLRGRFAGWALRDLVRYVYERYEKFTEKSVIRDQILGNRAQ